MALEPNMPSDDHSNSTDVPTRPQSTTSAATENRPGDADQPQESGWKRILSLSLAGMFFVLGALGAILPLLPATPFLLLTSYFLVRSSPRLNQTLLRSRLFGPILTDWQVHGGVRRDVKLQAVVFVTLAVAATIYFSGYSRTMTIIVLLLASSGIGVIIWLPEAKRPD